MRPTTTLILFAGLLVATLLGVGVHAATSTTADKVVEHEFTSTEAVSEFNSSGNVSSNVQNTEVVLSDAGPFLRVEAENPNAYPVELALTIDGEIVTASDLGTIDSVDEETSAEWSANQDFESGERYTVVRFTLEAGESATFAPSKARTLALAWTTRADEAAGMFGSSIFGDELETPQLKNSTYRFSGDEGEHVTVDLSEQDATVSEWFAEYRTTSSDWQPVESDAGDAVFVREGDESLEFIFNEDAEVEFTANPSTFDKVNHQVSSYVNGWSPLKDTLSGLFGTVVSV